MSEPVPNLPASSADTIERSSGLWIGASCVCTAAIGFSAKAVFVKLAYRHGVDAITVLTLRMLFSLPFFLLMCGWSKRPGYAQAQLGLHELGAIIVLGLMGYYLASLLDFMGLWYITAGLERLILFLYPTLVVLLSAALLRQAINPSEWLALMLSYLGIGLMFLHGISSSQDNLMLGALLVLGSALSYACYLLGSGRMIKRVGSVRFTAVAMTISCLAVFAQFTWTRPLELLIQPSEVIYLTLAMALVSTVLPALLLAEGLRRVGPSRTALLSTAGPVATLILGYFFLDESLSLAQLLGTALVLAGVCLVSVRR